MSNVNLPAIFSDLRCYRDAFIKGLERMLDHEELGAFILVLANASYDDSIFGCLQGRLKQRYEQLEEAFQRGLLQAPPDDLEVLGKLVANGFEQLQPTRYRHAGPWLLQYNQMRSLRPPRISKARVDGLQQPFNAEGFHFNKAFLQKEVLWQGDLMGAKVRLLYNKFPFADHHALLVYDPEAGHPQFLTEDVHYRVVESCRQLGERIPGIGIGYNAFGAAASVNHLHFQLYACDHDGYPIERDCWRHNGGALDYPLDCRRYNDGRQAWQYIAHLHAVNKAYNLIYRPGEVYVVTRKMQGHFTLDTKLQGIGWADVAGSITVFTRQDFAAIDEAYVLSQYREVALFDDE
jgi:hypothetical protein